MISTIQTKFVMDLFIFHKAIRSLKCFFFKLKEEYSVEGALQSLLKVRGTIRFVQVGGSDCGLNDPLTAYVLSNNAKGLIIEPIPEYFFKAQERYKSISGLKFYNCAIDFKRGIKKMYKIKNIPGLPDWAYQVCSFSKEILLKHKNFIPQIENLIETENVPTAPLLDLLQESGFEDVDLLLIDTEGYDAEVLKMFPFHLHRPLLVIFEHKHLPEDKKNNALRLLAEFKYKIYEQAEDVVAVLK
jgi:FkbM family methyltransferase